MSVRALMRAFEIGCLPVRRAYVHHPALPEVMNIDAYHHVDIDIIFDSLDDDKSGEVSMEEFCRLFEPTIVRRASSSASGAMDIDELMKEVFYAHFLCLLPLPFFLLDSALVWTVCPRLGVLLTSKETRRFLAS